METKNDESKKRTDFGYYEKRLCLLIMLSTIPNSLSTFQVLITQFTPPFHCDVENIYSGYENTSNISTGEFLNRTLPYIQNENNELVRSSCTYYNISLKDFASFNTSDNNEVVKCSKYKFYGPTKSATMQFSMVCDQAHLKPMMTSLFMLGKLVGGLIGGAISDRFGRRPCFLIFTVYQHVVSILQSFAGDSISYGILMFFNGFGALVNYMAIAILGTEFLPPRLRHVALFLNTAGYATGYMILPLLGYYIVDWRWFLRFSGFIGIFYLPYFWLLDETPYWLLSKGRVDEAKKVLLKVANLNGSKLDNDENCDNLLSLEDPNETIDVIKSWLVLFKTRKLLFRLIIISYSWFMVSIVYYTIAYGTNHLSGNRFMNMFYASLMELFSAFVYFFASFRCEQRNTFIIFTVICGVCVTLSPIIRSWNLSVSIALVMIGKLGSAVIFQVVYTYTSEIFPTAIRHSALATASMCSRFGGIVAPYLLYAGQRGQEATSTISIGVMAFISAILYLKLPTTKNLPLPKTIEQAKQMNRGVLFQCKNNKNVNVSEDIEISKDLE